ncbi:Pepco domain-containing protein [Streptomyces erythrochromogenes]|uniref:Pepco domain-containing protein n=1 Tax=Streptomyces erythrochromogenes TaxID=285574 RepID=UPI0002E628B0
MFQGSQASVTTTSASEETISFLVSIDDTMPSSGTGDMGIFSRSTDESGSVREIPVAVLRANLQRAVDGLQQVIGEIAVPEGGMPLRQAQVSFEVTASGGITLVGTSAQVAAKGAITLTFGS